MYLDGPAVEAGLRKEDVIEKLNGKDVQFSSADVVAAAIRYTHIFVCRQNPIIRG